MTSKAVLEAIRQGEDEANGNGKKAVSPTAKELIRDLEDVFRIVTGRSPRGLTVAEYPRPEGGVEYALFFNGASKPNKSIEVTASGEFLVDGKYRADHLPSIKQISRDAARGHKEALAKLNSNR